MKKQKDWELSKFEFNETYSLKWLNGLKEEIEYILQFVAVRDDRSEIHLNECQRLISFCWDITNFINDNYELKPKE